MPDNKITETAVNLAMTAAGITVAAFTLGVEALERFAKGLTSARDRFTRGQGPSGPERNTPHDSAT